MYFLVPSNNDVIKWHVWRYVGKDKYALQKRDQTLDRIIEIILYQLKAGTGGKFHQNMTKVSVPLHQNAGLDVLAYGHSLHAMDTYFLIRAFDSLEQMTATLDTFYNSDAWLNGPRSDILDAIRSSVKSVLPLNEATISALKSSWASGENCSSTTKTTNTERTDQ